MNSSFPSPRARDTLSEELRATPEFSALPDELFIHNIFLYLSACEIVHLSSTNKRFKYLCQDDAYWRRKLQEDFNFPVNSTTWKTRWLFLYQKLRSPLIYVWGHNEKGRIGNPDVDGQGLVASPALLCIPGVHVVSLIAGGWSFHAIDSKGDIYVWGTLDGEYWRGTRAPGFATPGYTAGCPMRLQLPVKFRAISCGQKHAMALGEDASVWTFTSWGRPFRLAYPCVTSGDVLSYWHSRERIRIAVEGWEAARVMPAAGNVIQCVPWALDAEDTEPTRLPHIPTTLPDLPRTGLPQDVLSQETKLVKIATLTDRIIGLTNKGHILRYLLTGHSSWQYLPLFSDINEIKKLQRSTRPGTAPVGDVPDTMHITHISGSCNTLFAYSVGARSTVLMGTMITDTTEPTLIPALQQQGPNAVVGVAVGEAHYGALTMSGRLLTWGRFMEGALGLGPHVGRDTEVRVPTEVRFDTERDDDGRRMFCFGATACGWHTGALVVDLDEVEKDDEVEHMGA